MQKNLLRVIKNLIPELSELEAEGYELSGVVNGTLSFDITASHPQMPSITFAGYYKTNGGKTIVRFERFCDEGEGQSETADYKITKITKDYCLFEQEWKDENDDVIKVGADIVKNSRGELMPYVGEKVANVLGTMAYKRYVKHEDKEFIRLMIKDRFEGSSSNC